MMPPLDLPEPSMRPSVVLLAAFFLLAVVL
jgi:hypothetical protein